MGRHYNPMDIDDTQAEFERSSRVEDQFYDEGGAQSDITCKRCGETELEWVHVGRMAGKEVWRLYDGQKLHKCKGTQASADDFDDL